MREKESEKKQKNETREGVFSSSEGRGRRKKKPLMVAIIPSVIVLLLLFVLVGPSIFSVSNAVSSSYAPALPQTAPEVYVANYYSSTISVIKGLKVVDTINDSNKYITFLSYDPHNHYIYGSDDYETIYAIDSKTNKIVGEIGGFKSPAGMEYVPLNNLLYVANPGVCNNPSRGNVAIVNTTTNKIVGRIKVGCPTNLAYVARNQKLYVSNPGLNIVSVINPRTNKVIDVIRRVPFVAGIAYNPYNNEIYVAGGGNVTVINASTNKIIAYVDLGESSYQIAYNPLNQDIYVPSATSTTVAVINATNHVVKVLEVGSEPWGIAYNPSNGYLYVTNSNSGTVSVIDGFQVIATITVGSDPFGVVAS